MGSSYRADSLHSQHQPTPALWLSCIIVRGYKLSNNSDHKESKWCLLFLGWGGVLKQDSIWYAVQQWLEIKNTGAGKSCLNIVENCVYSAGNI